jgi:predicted RNA-binding Zn-ribbon protein involved in translation (DUF1610 family)
MVKFGDVTFVCPDCGSEILAEIVVETQCVQMTNIHEDKFTRGRDLYDRQRSRVAGYECAQCGFPIARTEEEAVNWLTEHNMIKERE